MQVHRLQAKSAQLRAAQVAEKAIQLDFELRIVDGFSLVGAANLMQFVRTALTLFSRRPLVSSASDSAGTQPSSILEYFAEDITD